MGHLAANCEGKAKRKAGEFDEKGDADPVAKKPYQVFFNFSFNEVTGRLIVSCIGYFWSLFP